MNLSVIDHRDIDVAMKVWRLSRPGDKNTDEEQVMRIDSPVMDFPDVCLFVESTVLEREIFSTFRDHVMWARGSRTDDPLNFEVKVETEYTKHCREQMKKAAAEGKSQDEYRMWLPLDAICYYSVRISMRSLLKLQKIFAELPGFEDAAAESESLLNYLGLRDVKDSYKAIDIFSNYNDEAQSSSANGMISLVCDAPFSLRTQAVRHNLLFVRDEVSVWIESGIYHERCIGDNMKLEISTTQEVWRGLYRKRSCWLAQYDLWSVLLNQLDRFMVLSEDDLPCAGGACPYHADARLRIEHKDPNPPCPIHMKLAGIAAGEQEAKRMFVMMNRDNRPGFWLKKIKESL